MTLQLTQKEKQLLKDQTSHEKVCIQKYQQYASKAEDPQLKQLFRSYAQQEQTHLDTLNSLLNGQAPSMSQQGQSQGQGQQGMQSQAGQSQQANGQSGAQATSLTGAAQASQADAMLCSDMLMTEKYVSGAYDTAIFEFTDANVRQTLNHIQKEEQQHGEGIYNYLSSHGMYSTQ
ncbi:spore coat protein [Anaeroselena agilis]|uniref:Spore coat protein n=1 Tax=Anaeroselena agilis TaxID=3063788 RepID=A0ABU3NXS5_9FIRM|nr:spore coat protein [Selenomonadales bacterium 4137-cl]